MAFVSFRFDLELIQSVIHFYESVISYLGLESLRGGHRIQQDFLRISWFPIFVPSLEALFLRLHHRGVILEFSLAIFDQETQTV